MNSNKLVSGSILEIPLPLGIGYGYAVFILVNDFLNLSGTIDRILIPINHYSKNKKLMIDFPTIENELTAPILTFKPRIRGENCWRIIGYIDPLNFNFQKIAWRSCLQYNPDFYGKELELTWYHINDYELLNKEKLDISKNLHLEQYEVNGSFLIECRLLFELNECYNLQINYQELFKRISAQYVHSEFMILPRYKEIPKEFWGKVME